MKTYNVNPFARPYQTGVSPVNRLFRDLGRVRGGEAFLLA